MKSKLRLNPVSRRKTIDWWMQQTIRFYANMKELPSRDTLFLLLFKVVLAMLPCAHSKLLFVIVNIVSLVAYSLPAFAQLTIDRRFPNDRYYAALSLLREGRLQEAHFACEASYRLTRQNGEQHGIDSVPVLVRLGECLYYEGDIAGALQQYDNALELSVRTANWIQLMQAPTWVVRPLPSDQRGIQWYRSRRGNELGVYPEAYPVAIGFGGIITEAGNGAIVSTAELIRLDAIEVYLTQAIALRGRYRILGEMASQLPQTRRYAEAFPTTPANYPESLQCSHNICRALSMIGMGDTRTAENLLKSNLTLQGGWDHPLTGVALLALADLAMMKMEGPNAIDHLLEASLVFGRLNQFTLLAETMDCLGSTAAFHRQANMLNVLETMNQWSKTRSYLAFAYSASAGTALALEINDAAKLDSFAQQLQRSNTRNIVDLPYCMMLTKYASGRMQIRVGNTTAGNKLIDQSLQLGYGEGLLGPQAFGLIRANQILAAVNRGDISIVKGSQLADSWLDGPSQFDWSYYPASALATATYDAQNIKALWFDQAVKGNQPETVVQAIDRMHGFDWNYNMPIAGREMTMRMLFDGPPLQMQMKDWEKLRLPFKNAFPGIDQNADSIQQNLANVKKIEPMDAKNWSLAERNLWSEFSKLVDQQEVALNDAALGRIVLPKLFPPRAMVEDIKRATQPDAALHEHAILGFHVSGPTIRGYLIMDGSCDSWIVDQATAAITSFRDLIANLTVNETPQRRIDMLQKDAWKGDASRLRAQLIPDAQYNRLLQKTHWMVIPDDWLWYVPFETFPETAAGIFEPVIARHTIAFAPTIGTVELNPQPARPVTRSLGVYKPQAFINDKEVDAKVIDAIATQIPDTVLLESQSKAVAARWAKLVYDQVWVSAPLEIAVNQPLNPLGIEADDVRSLKDWARTPLHSPARIYLTNSSVPSLFSSDKPGSELFHLACILKVTRNEATVIQRWRVRGGSSEALLSGYLEGLSLSPAEAWQRSVLASWENTLPVADEPSLIVPKKESATTTIPGKHPFFWANGMVLSTQPSVP